MREPQEHTESLFRALGTVAPLQNIAFSPNGEWMVTGNTDNVLQFYRDENPEFSFRLSAHEVKMATLMRIRSLAFDPTAPNLYVACGNLIWCLDLTAESVAWTASTHRLFAFQGILANEVCCHPDGLLAYSFDNGHFGIRNASGIRLKSWRHNAGPRWMGFVNKGEHLIGSDGFSIKRWDLSTGVPTMDYHSPTRVFKLVTSENTAHFAARTLHRVLVYRQDEPQPIIEAQIGMGLPLMAFSDDGSLLAYNSDDEIHVMHVESGEVATVLFDETQVQGMAFEPGSGNLAIAGSDGLVHMIQVADSL